jgi:hypothetical protein
VNGEDCSSRRADSTQKELEKRIAPSLLSVLFITRFLETSDAELKRKLEDEVVDVSPYQVCPSVPRVSPWVSPCIRWGTHLPASHAPGLRRAHA